MIETEDIPKLEDYEAEDISDVIVKLEKSFGLKFDEHAFENVKTFGDRCDTFEEHIKYENRTVSWTPSLSSKDYGDNDIQEIEDMRKEHSQTEFYKE